MIIPENGMRMIMYLVPWLVESVFEGKNLFGVGAPGPRASDQKGNYKHVHQRSANDQSL